MIRAFEWRGMRTMMKRWVKWAGIAGAVCVFAQAVVHEAGAAEEMARTPIRLALIEGMSGPFADAGAADGAALPDGGGELLDAGAGEALAG